MPWFHRGAYAKAQLIFCFYCIFGEVRYYTPQGGISTMGIYQTI